MQDFAGFIFNTFPLRVLYDFLGTVKAAPHECLIRTGQL